MDNSISKNILKNELFAGWRPAVELLYTRYSGMLFSFILQWVPDRDEAGEVLKDVFLKLTPRLQLALDSDLSVYCWLQAETRKIVLVYMGERGDWPGGEGFRGLAGERGDSDALSGSAGGFGAWKEAGGEGFNEGKDAAGEKRYFFSLLEEASPEYRWVFRELYLFGRGKEELAVQSGMGPGYISRILREALQIIRNKLA